MINNQQTSDFITALQPGSKQDQIIIVKFSNRVQEVKYTKTSLDLLLSDPDTRYILDATTGEIIYYKEPGETLQPVQT